VDPAEVVAPVLFQALLVLSWCPRFSLALLVLDYFNAIEGKTLGLITSRDISLSIGH
jgi:hypothetical protein